MATFNLNTPNIPDEADILTQLRQIRSYITNLNNQLRYDLSNIDEDNLTGGELPENAISRGFRQKVLDLQGNMSVFEQTATHILARVENAEGDLSTLEQTATSFATRIQGVEDDGVLLRTDVNQNKSDILLRASKTSVDALTGRVSTAESSISTQAGEIALKASQSSVDALGTRVGSAETTLAFKADQATLTSTANGLQSQINQVPGQIELAVGAVQVGGRNYLSNARFSKDNMALTGWSNNKSVNLAITGIDSSLDPDGYLMIEFLQNTSTPGIITRANLDYNSLVDGKKYTLTARIYRHGGYPHPAVRFTIGAFVIGATAGTNYQKLSFVFNKSAVGADPYFLVYVNGAETAIGRQIYISHITIMEGDKTPDSYVPGKLDPASGVKTSKVTIDGTGIDMTTGGVFTTTSQNFNIDAAGNVTMKGQVEATSGKIGGFSLSSGKLIDTATNGDKMEIDPVNGILDVGDFRIMQSSSHIDLFNQQTTGSTYMRILNSVGPISLMVGGANLSVHEDNFYAFGGPFNVDSLYAQGNVSALSFTDRTPAYFGDALDELRWTSGSRSKGIDHSSIPKFAQKKVLATRLLEDGSKEDYEEEARDLGAMVSVLTRAVQQLADKVDSQQRLIEDLSRRVNA